MSKHDSKHIQTELTGDEYETFREFAKERGMTVKEAGHEALIGWIERQRRVDPTGPAFTVLDDLNDESLPATADTDARTEADLVDEWEGSDVEFTLADDPPTES